MSVLVGIDEVGRGCWAGPLVAGAVILDKPIAGLKDSKLLTRQQREKLAAQIYIEATSTGLGWVKPREIDRLGLSKAIALAMKKALTEIHSTYDEIIVDGNFNYLLNNPRAHALIRADSLIPAVSAASIIAKVARDKYMYEMAKHFPVYAFDKHVGYGTRLHSEMLKLHGICELHRLTYKPVRALL